MKSFRFLLIICLILLIAIVIYLQYISINMYIDLKSLGSIFILYPLCVFSVSFILQLIIFMKSIKKRFFVLFPISYIVHVFLIRPILSPLNYFDLRILQSDDFLGDKIRYLMLDWIRIDIFVLFGCFFIVPMLFLYKKIMAKKQE